MVTIYAMCGAPGSGKSYYGKKFAAENHCYYISSDELRNLLFGSENVQTRPDKVFRFMDSLVESCINWDVSVVYDSTLSKLKDRKSFIDKFSDKANLVLIYMQTSLEECIRRNNARDRVVEQKVIEKHFNRLKMNAPSLNEGWKEIIYVK